jgi:thiamine biosynthesis protein ThiS
MNTNLKTIQVMVNGENRAFDGGLTVTEMLVSLGLHPRLIVVEYNREILDRARYDDTDVRDGDAFELVHFVGGG